MTYRHLALTFVPCVVAVLLAAGCSPSGSAGNAPDKGAGEGMGPMSPHTDIPDSPGRVPAKDTADGGAKNR